MIPNMSKRAKLQSTTLETSHLQINNKLASLACKSGAESLTLIGKFNLNSNQLFNAGKSDQKIPSDCMSLANVHGELPPSFLRGTLRPKKEMTTEMYMNMLNEDGGSGGSVNGQGKPFKLPGISALREIGLQ